MNNYIKGILILISMIMILGLGIGYLITVDPAKEQRAIFNLVFEEFELMSKDLQKAFHMDEALPPSRKSVTKHYRDKTGKEVPVTFNIIVEPNKVTVEFLDASSEQTSVEFEPIIKVHKKNQTTSVKWICSGGTMLLKFRSKPCRTVKGLSIESL